MGLNGLNLGGADKNPATPPSGPSDQKPTTADRPESQANTANTATGQNEQGTVNQTIESIAKNETNTQVNTGEGTRENDLDPGAKLEPKDPSVESPAPDPAAVGETDMTDKQRDASATRESLKLDSERSSNVLETAEAILADDDVVARYSSHPIMRYSLGDWHFDQGLLILRSQDDADAFEAELKKQPLSEQNRVRKLDLDEANRLAREAIARSGGATKGIDSSTGDRAPNKQVGTGSLTGE